jgi:signal peptidase II
VTAPTAPGRPRWGIFLPLAAAVVAVDQLSKAWLTGLLAPGERQAVIGDLLRIVHGQNSGALFGLFQDQALLFGLVSLAVVAMIVGYHATSGRRPVLSLALGLLLGGAIGNMLDRFRLGHVVDWIDAGIGDLRFYTFNVADASISGAILLLIVLALLGDRLDRPADRPAGTSAGGRSEPLDA